MYVSTDYFCENTAASQVYAPYCANDFSKFRLRLARIASEDEKTFDETVKALCNGIYYLGDELSASLTDMYSKARNSIAVMVVDKEVEVKNMQIFDEAEIQNYIKDYEMMRINVSYVTRNKQHLYEQMMGAEKVVTNSYTNFVVTLPTFRLLDSFASNFKRNYFCGDCASIEESVYNKIGVGDSRITHYCDIVNDTRSSMVRKGTGLSICKDGVFAYTHFGLSRQNLSSININSMKTMRIVCYECNKRAAETGIAGDFIKDHILKDKEATKPLGYFNVAGKFKGFNYAANIVNKSDDMDERILLEILHCGGDKLLNAVKDGPVLIATIKGLFMLQASNEVDKEAVKWVKNFDVLINFGKTKTKYKNYLQAPTTYMRNFIDLLRDYYGFDVVKASKEGRSFIVPDYYRRSFLELSVSPSSVKHECKYKSYVVFCLAEDGYMFNQEDPLQYAKA